MKEGYRTVLIRAAAAGLFLCLVAGVVWFSRGGVTRPQKQKTYEEEIEAVRKKYEPLRARHDEILRVEGVDAGVEFYQREIAKPSFAEMNAVRARHGKPPLPE